MNRKKWNIGLAAVLLVALGLTGYFAIAAEYGSKDDPLVTLSYINDVLAPGTMKQIDELLAAKKTEFESQIDKKMTQLNSDIDAKIASVIQSGSSAQVSDALVDAVAAKVLAQLNQSGGAQDAANWAVVKIPAGKTLTGKVGCEVILRIGNASCVASSSPGLINLSTGADLSNGKALTANNLYIVTIEGRGVYSAGGCTVLVNGSYTIG